MKPKVTPYIKTWPALLSRCPICHKKQLEVGFCQIFKGWPVPENWAGNEYEICCLHCGAIGTGPDYHSAISAVKRKETKMSYGKKKKRRGR